MDTQGGCTPVAPIGSPAACAMQTPINQRYPVGEWLQITLARLNELLHLFNETNAPYCEGVRRCIERLKEMEDQLKSEQ